MGINIFQIVDVAKEYVTPTKILYYENKLNHNFGSEGKISRVFAWCAAFNGKGGATYSPKEVLELFDDRSAPYLIVESNYPWNHIEAYDGNTLNYVTWKRLVKDLKDNQSIIFYKARN